MKQLRFISIIYAILFLLFFTGCNCSSDDDDDDDQNLTDCYQCSTTYDCADEFGQGWGCVNGCCEEIDGQNVDGDNDDNNDTTYDDDDDISDDDDNDDNDTSDDDDDNDSSDDDDDDDTSDDDDDDTSVSYELTLTCQSPISSDDGTSQCNARLEDEYGTGLPGLTLTTSSTCASLPTVTDLGGGDYSFIAFDIRRAGQCDITASYFSAEDTDTITVNAGATNQATLSMPSSVNADVGQATATATFSDTWNNPLEGLTVTFSSDIGTVSTVTELGSGMYEVTITDLRAAGTAYEASAEADGVTGYVYFDITPGSPNSISVTATSTIPSDGTTPSDITATVEDAWANPVPGQSVSITSDLGNVSTVTDQGDGTYTAQVTSNSPGTATITAEVGLLSDQTTVLFTCYIQPPPAGGTNGCPIDYRMEITVIDDNTGLPLQGAFVQVGLNPDDPFTDNSGLTDSGGVISFNDPALIGAQYVTAGVPGSIEFTFLTMVEVDANRIVMPLKRQGRKTYQTSSISGDIGGFVTTDNDGVFDAGLVIPTLQIESLLALNYDMLLGDYVTRQLPFSQTADIPGNVYAPSQTELLFITIEFAPYEGLNLDTNTYQDMFCLAGNVPLTDMLALITDPDPDLADVVGLLTFTKAGISRNHLITGDMTIDFDLTNDMTYNLDISVDNTPAQSEVYMVAFADMDQMGGLGKLVPMGFTMVDGGTPATETIPTINTTGDFANMDILAGAAITNWAHGGITTQIQRSGVAPGVTVTVNSFFDYILGMSQIGRQYSFIDPENSVSPAMDVQLSSIYLNNSTTETITYQWDIIAPSDTFILPTLDITLSDYPLTNPTSTPDTDSLIWETSAYGLTIHPGYEYDGFALEGIRQYLTHFTYGYRTVGFVK